MLDKETATRRGVAAYVSVLKFMNSSRTIEASPHREILPTKILQTDKTDKGNLSDGALR